MRERIRKEYGWELAGENCMYFKELRWDARGQRRRQGTLLAQEGIRRQLQDR